MKFQCSKSDLLNAVNISLKAVSSKTTMTILECILIEADTSGEIKFTSNDMELGIETKIYGKVDEAGMIALDAKLFSEMVRKLPDSVVSLTSDASLNTVIKCEQSVFNITGRDGEDFSYLPDVVKTDYISISQFTLKDIIRQTIFALSPNDNNKLMTGELFEIKGNNLRVVALDGHRVAIRKIELKSRYDEKSMIIPGKTLQEIVKLLSGDVDDMINIYFTDNHILFEYEDTKIVSRLIEGEYFNIDHMISNEYSTRVKVNKKEFTSCVDRSTLLVKEGDKKPIVMDIKDNYIQVKINSFLGSLDEMIMAQKEGKDLMIGFNPNFFIDCLRVIDDEEINLYMMTPKSPCFIKDEEGTYVYLVLPVNFIA